MDYEMYGPLVREGGIIAIPDIAQDINVRRFWDELEVPKEPTSVREARMGVIKK